jgi:hypothetical protein
MSARRNRGTVGLATVGLLAGVVVATALAFALGSPAPGPDPSVAPAAGGPVVFYEVLGADASLLMARTLDGRSLARVVAGRPSLDYGRTWTVDPAGGVAIAQFNGSGASRLEAVDTATGTSRWVVDAPVVNLGLGVWSTEGDRFAGATEPEDAADREAVIVDAANGTVVRVSIPLDVVLQGFDGDGGLVLRQRLTADGNSLGWRFLRIDPANAKIEQLPIPPAIGPSTAGGEDVDPGIGIGLDSAPREDEAASDLRVWSLAGGEPRTVATFESVDTITLDPSGRLVAIGVGQTSVVVAGLDGHSSPIWSGQGRGDVAWSTGGDYLGINSWDKVSRIDVIERATGRVVALPLPSGIAQASLARIVGGEGLPETALPAVEPTPTPTPGPSGPDVATRAALIAGWIDQTGERSFVHVERLSPTELGGMRTAAEMEPADLGVTPAGPSGETGDDVSRLSLLPRPASQDILVWVDGPAGSRAWLWSPGGSRRDLALPTDWPPRTSDVSWRPDGLAIAATAYETNADDTTRSGFVIGILGGGTKWFATPPGYDRLEGWWTQDELLVGHGICTEGCPGRYSYSARLLVADGTLRQFSGTENGRLPIHLAYPAESGDAIVLSAVNEDPAHEIRIDWPASVQVEGGLEVIGWSSRPRSLFVVARTASGPVIYRIDDPIGRARAGDLTDPAPVRVGGLPSAGFVSVSISPDGRWAHVSDRTGASQLVELASGRTWPIDRAAMVVWSDGD